MYRRALSPYNTRVASYLDALERDEAMNSLRREYAHHRAIESEYDDLAYEIAKTERENRKLAERQGSIEIEYVEKVRENKCMISELGLEIEQIEEKLNNISKNSITKQTVSEIIVHNIKQRKAKISKLEEESKSVCKEIEEHERTVANLGGLIDELEEKKNWTKIQNKNISEALETEFNEYKTVQESIKTQEAINDELEREVTTLKKKKLQKESSALGSNSTLKEINKKLHNCQYEAEKLNGRYQEMEKELAKVCCEVKSLKENIDGTLNRSKAQTNRLKEEEEVLKENNDKLNKKQANKESLLIEYSNMMKDIEKAESIIRAIDLEIEDYENINKGLLENLKRSIASDEEAIKSLSRKAALLDLISQA